MGLPDASPPGDEENCRRTSGRAHERSGLQAPYDRAGFPTVSDGLRFLGAIGSAALLLHRGEIGSKPELADLGG